MPIDLNVGEALATSPVARDEPRRQRLHRLPGAGSRAPGAQDPNAPPGYFGGEVRVARYNGWLWSQLGQPADRNPSAPFATPDRRELPEGRDRRERERHRRLPRARRRLRRPRVGTPDLRLDLRHPADRQPAAVRRRAAARARRRVLARRHRLRAGRGGAAPAARAAGRRARRSARVREPDPRDVQRRGRRSSPARGSPTARPVGRSAAVPARRRRASARTAASSWRSGWPPRRAPRRAARQSVAALRRRSATAAAPSSADPVIEVAETAASVAAWKARQTVVGIEESREDGKVAVKGVRAAAGGAVHDVQIAGSNLGDALVAFLQGDQDARSDRSRGGRRSATVLRRRGAAEVRALEEGAARLGRAAQRAQRAEVHRPDRQAHGRAQARAQLLQGADAQAEGRAPAHRRDRDRRQRPAREEHAGGAAARPQGAARACLGERQAAGTGADRGRHAPPRRRPDALADPVGRREALARHQGHAPLQEAGHLQGDGRRARPRRQHAQDED